MPDGKKGATQPSDMGNGNKEAHGDVGAATWRMGSLPQEERERLYAAVVLMEKEQASKASQFTRSAPAFC